MSRLSSDMESYLSDSFQSDTPNIPEDSDLLMSSGESMLTIAPPPHISARFSHPTRARRRSSAASSRRNSFSSTHSHHSQRSYHGPQSSHVAQHLRRASILESRKARLADKAAHADKVRLRAALAKAASRPSNTEERALAAEKAREKYLAQVAAVCAEEVKRAKKVAEDIKEKREQEGRKLREDMEERLAEAQRRRLVYQQNLRRARATSASTPTDKKFGKDQCPRLDDEEAAKRIQKGWRLRRRKATMEEFRSVGLSIEGVRGVSFDDATTLLAQDKVISITTKVLRLCRLLEEGTWDEKTAVRTFLSAFIILGHPSQVLSHEGEQEKDLLAKCRDLLISFEQLLSHMTQMNSYTPAASGLDSLSETYNSFCTAFNAWKSHDSSILLQTMIAQFVELDSIWQTIQVDSEEAVKAEYKEGIHDNQIKLLVRIKRLAGPEKGTEMVKAAIRTARRSRAQARTGHPRPRLAESSLTEPMASQGEGRGDAGAPAAVDSKIPALHPPMPSSQGASMQTNELMKVFSPLPDNRTLLHELAINKDYRIDAASVLNSDAKQTTNRAVFDSMRQEIEAGRGTRWICAMAENVRSRLLRLLAPGNSLHVIVTEALDPAVIARECSMGSFSYERFFSFMYSILPQLCAEFRDPEFKALEADRSGDVIDRLERVMHFIDLLSLDFANYLLQSSAPVLIPESAGYEHNLFRQDLSTKVITLRNMEQWWTSAREAAFTEANRRDPEGVNHPANRPTLEKIYMHALVDLFIAVPNLDKATLPETLRLDKNRIVRIRRDTLRIVVIGSILLTAKNLLKRDVRAQWKSEVARIWEVLRNGKYDASAGGNIMSILESMHMFPPPVKLQLNNAVTRTLTQAQQRTFTDPVSKLLLHRLKAHILGRLSATSAGDRVRAASTASEGLASSGLPEFVGRIGAMVDELGRVAEVDRAAHGTWYEEVARKADR
ncbi:MAG: hypothetical protein M1833_002847 [Piccolia ochrophora]|nr:MAG: hypothetical protein M1833_002847 [Piccolia ochrophora]